MSDKEILERAIEKAEKNGFDMDIISVGLYDLEEYPDEFVADIDISFQTYPYEVIILDHDFAKAFWGEKLTRHPQYKIEKYYNNSIPEWQYHLQQMVLEEEPLKYLERFL